MLQHYLKNNGVLTYQNLCVGMVGGVTLNGQQIYTEALQDIEKLEQEIRSTYELNLSNNDRIMS